MTEIYGTKQLDGAEWKAKIRLWTPVLVMMGLGGHRSVAPPAEGLVDRGPLL